MKTWLKKPSVQKKIVEAIVGAPFAAVIGYLVITEKKTVDRALAHFFPEEEKTEESTED
jgi:hypothetical protein